MPPMTPITCARPSPPKGGSPSSPTIRRAQSNIRSTSIFTPNAISSNAASRNSSSFAALRPASKRQPETSSPSSLSQPPSSGCGKCPQGLEEAIGKHGRPEIFNSDQGSQFTSEAFTGVLLANGIAISMDGKGAWRDNVFVERLWRSVKYEEVYLKAYDTVAEARASLGRYLDFYNRQRPHSSLDRRTPDEAYFHPTPLAAAA